MSDQLNMLAEAGMKPAYDMYRIEQKKLEAMCVSIIKDRTGHEINVLFEYDEEDGDALQAYLSPVGSESSEDFEQDVRDDLLAYNFDPDDARSTAEVLMCVIGRSDRTYGEWGYFNPINREDILQVYIPARKEILLEAREALDQALNGTRDETIIALNKIIKRTNYDNFNLVTGEDKI